MLKTIVGKLEKKNDNEVNANVAHWSVATINATP